MLSFIIPAHNEEACLPHTLAALKDSAQRIGRNYEVIVANDASNDRTREIALEHGARVIDVEHRQISATRNSGGRAAAGDFLFFIDADTQANADAIQEAIAAMEAGAVGGGCHFSYDCPLPLWGRILLPIGNFLGRRLTMTGGAFLFCRRAEFEAVGGFDEHLFAAEDLVFVKALKKRGRFFIPRTKVVTSGRKIDRMTLRFALVQIVRFVLAGPSIYQSREGLGLWYGPEAREGQ
jgi:glycosyltransferase involved in cell wall biosynthesis